MNTMDQISQQKITSQLYSQVAFINPNLYYNSLFQKNILPINSQNKPKESNKKTPKKNKSNRNIFNFFINCN